MSVSLWSRQTPDRAVEGKLRLSIGHLSEIHTTRSFPLLRECDCSWTGCNSRESRRGRIAVASHHCKLSNASLLGGTQALWSAYIQALRCCIVVVYIHCIKTCVPINNDKSRRLCAASQRRRSWWLGRPDPRWKYVGGQSSVLTTSHPRYKCHILSFI